MLTSPAHEGREPNPLPIDGVGMVERIAHGPDAGVSGTDAPPVDGWRVERDLAEDAGLRGTLATLDQLGTDVSRVQTLVREAVVKLSDGFAMLSEQGHRQRDVLQALLKRDPADAAATGSGRQLEQFVADTQDLVREVVHCLALAGQRTGRLAVAMDSAVAAMEEVSRMTRETRRIADHTRIVALNASIEAAHAGSFGVGFAVVAQEITRLSSDARALSDNMSERVTAARSELCGAHGDATTTASEASALAESAEGRMAHLEHDVRELERHLANSLAGAQTAATMMSEGVGQCVHALQFEDMVSQLSLHSGQRVAAVSAVLQSMVQLRMNPEAEHTPGAASRDHALSAMKKATSTLASMTARQVVEQKSMDAGDIELF